MGVKDLWNIVSPLGERKPLYTLEGKTIAVDLSAFIVDSQNVSSLPKIHLRNLFFRTQFFLTHNITPIFILEGTAPTLKHNTIAKRNNNRPDAVVTNAKKGGGRKQFNTVLKECKELLKLMGIDCIQGVGEAEALCAYLNEDGLVDGCLSQDSDCFLYGAKVVYRNYCTVKHGSSGSIDEYSIEKIQRVHNLGRNKMIALALICGCDYDQGLFGVGKEAALKFFKTVKEDEVLERMKQWKTSSEFNRMERELSDPNLCKNCGHTGKVTSHKRVGCKDCETEKSCNDSYKEKRALMANELTLRKKALENENFPNQELLDEFLIRKDSVPTKLDFKWKTPKIIEFISFMERVQWEPSYSFKKIFPLVIRWQLLNLSALSDEKERQNKESFAPIEIQKVKIRQGVSMFQILWQDKHEILKRINISEDEEDDDKILSENDLITIEPQDLFTTCYPDTTKVYEELKNKKKTKRVRETKKKTTKDNTAVTKKNKDNVKNKKMTDFLAVDKLEDSFKSMEITPKRRKGPESDSNELEEINQALNSIEISSIFKKVSSNKVKGVTSVKFQEILSKLTPDDCPSDFEFSDEENLEILKNTSIDSLNSSIERMLNELTPDDFPSSKEYSDDELSDLLSSITRTKRE